jgi:DNA-binding MarR family transcriptional regulator
MADGTRWLSAEELAAWRSLLDATQLLMDRLGDDLEADAGLSHADYEVFVRLSDAEGHRMRMSELSDRTSFSRSRLSHAVRRLEARGFVSREPCPGDRRGTVARLTDAGYAHLVAAAPGHVAGVRRYVFDALDPADVTALQRISTAILDAIAAAPPTPVRPGVGTSRATGQP